MTAHRPVRARLDWLLPALAALALWSTLAALGARLAHVPPFLLLAVTLGLGSLPSLPYWRGWAARPAVLAFGVAGIFGYHFLLFMALRSAPAVEANLLNYLWPVLIVLLSPVFLRGYRLSARQVAGGLVAFAGAALVVTGGRFEAPRAEHVPGYLMALGAALTWSSYSVLTKRLPPFPSSAVGGFCLVSAVLAALCHALLEPRALALVAPSDWLWLGWLGLGPMGLAFYAWDRALKRGDPRVVGALSYLTPLSSTAALVVTANKPLTAGAASGLVLVVVGAVLGTWSGQRPLRGS